MGCVSREQITGGFCVYVSSCKGVIDYDFVGKKTTHKLIYLARTPNGKCYIGQTADYRLDQRINEHLQKARKCPGIYNAIKKYGAENIKWEVLDCVLYEHADEAEKFYIALYRSFGEDGYNLTDGGDCPRFHHTARRKMAKKKLGKKNPMYGKGHKVSGERNGMYGKGHLVSGKRNGTYGKPPWNKGRKTSAQTRAKQSRALMGITRSEETRKKISESKRGCVFSPEHRKKLSIAAKRRKKKAKKITR